MDKSYSINLGRRAYAHIAHLDLGGDRTIRLYIGSDVHGVALGVGLQLSPEEAFDLGRVLIQAANADWPVDPTQE